MTAEGLQESLHLLRQTYWDEHSKNVSLLKMDERLADEECVACFIYKSLCLKPGSLLAKHPYAGLFFVCFTQRAVLWKFFLRSTFYVEQLKRFGQQSFFSLRIKLGFEHGLFYFA